MSYEILILLGLLILLFLVPSQLPKLGRAFGEFVRDVKDTKKELGE